MALLVAIFSSLLFLKAGSQGQLAENKTTTPNLIMMGIKGALQSSEKDSLQKLIVSLKNHPDIKYLKITDSKGNTLSQIGTIPPQGTKDLNHSEQTEKPALFQRSDQDIYLNNLKIGEVDLIISNSNNAFLPQQKLNQLITFTLISVVGISLIAFFIGLYLTKKLMLLKKAFNNLEQNGPGYLIEPVSQNIDNNDVISAFNRMSLKLKQTNLRLNKAVSKFASKYQTNNQNRDHAKAILAASLDAIVTIDNKGVIVEFNHIAEKIFGWDAKDIIGQTLNSTIVPKSYRHAHEIGFERYNITGETSILNRVLHLEALHKKGHIFPIEISISELKLPEKTLFTAFIRDVSERVEIENQMKLSAVALKAANPLMITDNNLKILTLNEAYTKLVGYKIEEIQGSVPEITSPLNQKQTYYNELWACLGSQEPWNGEHLFIKKDGSHFHGKVSISPIIDDHNQTSHYVIQIVDISSLKSTLKALRDTQAEAEKANLAKSQFLANMSHEIRTPLHSIITVNELLLKSHLSPEARNLVDISLQGGNSLISIINDILDFSKIEAGEMKLKKSSFDLVKIVEEVIELFQHPAKEKNILILSSIEPEMDCFFYGDSVRIKQILTNLMSNAVKFTNRGGISINLGLSELKEVIIEVEDTGEGMSKEDCQNVFSEFFQANSSNTKQHEGTGLGLAIVQNLVKLMHGEVSLKSQKGSGTCFTIKLPLNPDINAKPLKEKTDHSSRVNAAMVISDHDFLTKKINEQLLALDVELLNFSALPTMDSPAKRFQSIAIFVTQPLEDSLEDKLALFIKESTSAIKVYLINDLTSEESQSIADTSFQTLKLPLFPFDISEIINDGSLTERTTHLPQEEPINIASNHHKKILIVDDSKTNQVIAQNLLAKRNYQFEIANHGVEAVEKTLQGHFDLILMDVRMPVMDGLEATKRIRSIESPDHFLPIIAMTANAFVQDEEACIAAGMNDFLTKPLNIDQFYQKLENWLAPPSSPQPEKTIEIEKKTAPVSEDVILNHETLKHLIRDVGPELFPQILDIFSEETSERLIKMDDYWKSNDIHSLSLEAHALKSSAGSFGLKALQKLAYEIEAQNKEFVQAELDQKMKQLPNLASQSLEAVQNHQNGVIS